MALYLFQGNYPAASAKALVDNPQDREARIRPLFEAAGGKLHHLYFALGESDWITIAELPDNVAAAAVAFAVSSSGTLSNCKTTPLFTQEEGMAAMKRAQTLSFAGPGRT